MPVYHRTRRLQIYGDKPEVTTLFGNRYQMVVRCEAKHDTEAWYNANKSQIFADFGTLYDAEMAIDGIEPRTGEAYDNMVLVSNEASYTRTGEYIVTFVYQTLTADFVQEAADKVDYELNGLRRVTRPLIAKDGSDYYNVPDAMVVEGAGTEVANRVYLRNGDLNGKPLYGTNSDDGIFSGVSSIIWVVAIGGANLYLRSEDVATPDLVEVWDLEDGDAPAPTVRRATWADIEAAGIDPSTVPVLSGSEKVVGTSTISHTEHGYDTETLTLASAVEDAKGPNEGGYVRIVETWIEPGTLSESEDKVGSQKAITIQAIGEVPSTPAGYVLAQTQESDVEGIPTNRYTFLEPSILSVSTPKVGGQQRVQVQAFNLEEATVVSEVSEVTANHELIDITTSDVDGIPTRSFTFEVDDFEVLSATENGLKQLTRTELSSTNFTRGTIGTDTYESLTLAGEEIDNDGIIKRRVSRWAEAGILNASKEFAEDGLLYVTFISQGTKFTPTALNATKSLTDIETEAFQGGADATVRFSRVRDVNGFRKFEVTVMLQKDGSVLTSGTVVKTRRTWENYEYPGYVDTSFSAGIVPVPGGNIPILVEITETMTTDGNLTATPAPFSIKQGCYANVNYIPTETGLAESLNKAFGTNYLAGGLGITGSNTTFMGMEVSSIAGGGGSNPTYSGFLATNDPILAKPIVEDFVTDEGVQWYRIQQTTLVGTFGTYN